MSSRREPPVRVWTRTSSTPSRMLVVTPARVQGLRVRSQSVFTTTFGSARFAPKKRSSRVRRGEERYPGSHAARDGAAA